LTLKDGLFVWRCVDSEKRQFIWLRLTDGWMDCLWRCEERKSLEKRHTHWLGCLLAYLAICSFMIYL
jgi:hypothetical protein